MYFLNTDFQRNLSGVSLYEILNLIFEEDVLLENGIIFENYSDTIEEELEDLSRQIQEL